MMSKINKKGILMKKNWLGKVLIMVGIAIPMLSATKNKNFDTEHGIKIAHEISVIDDSTTMNITPIKSVTHYTPPAPYDNVTFIITAPVKVCVGQTFTIDYAIKVSKFTHISFWADLIPDSAQGLPVHVIHVGHPTIGTVDKDDATIAHKGGKGLWLFPKGLPHATVQQVNVTLKATGAGLIKFATFVATNPPLYIGSAGTLVSCNTPVISPIHVTGHGGQPIEISILDYAIADSELKVLSATATAYGDLQLNEDHTITYTPYPRFYGNDSFTYSVIDAAGNVVNGIVTIYIEHSPTPQIIQ